MNTNVEIQTGVPSAHITTNRNRLKSYGDKVYLKDGTNFEIELFNPLTTRVLVKIEIDGMNISEAGIVMNPGQRHYLERWIDEPKKFLFSTYEVEDSSEAKAAIDKNGRIKVSFFTEYQKPLVNYPGNFNNFNNYPYSYPNVPTYYFDVSSVYYSGTNVPQITMDMCSCSIDSVETGRSEKGADSDQVFESACGDFNTWTTKVCEWKILPDSNKPVEIKQLRKYCPNCRNRIRKETWKFCPVCGEEF